MFKPMVYCQNSQSQTKAVILVFKRKELLYDAENCSFVEGDIMKTDNEHARQVKCSTSPKRAI